MLSRHRIFASRSFQNGKKFSNCFSINGPRTDLSVDVKSIFLLFRLLWSNVNPWSLTSQISKIIIFHGSNMFVDEISIHFMRSLMMILFVCCLALVSCLQMTKPIFYIFPLIDLKRIVYNFTRSCLWYLPLCVKLWSILFGFAWNTFSHLFSLCIFSPLISFLSS